MASVQTERRMALVIGNSSYKAAAQLKNPASDAKVLATKLTDLGFEVRVATDLDGETFQRSVGEFCADLKKSGDKADAALLFFAGHGVQVRGDNYLLPIDGDIRSEVDLKLRTVHLNVVLEAMAAAAKTSVVLLDCCRDNPLPRLLAADGRSRSVRGDFGLAGMDAPSGAFVAFATQPDNVAEDGTGANSPFTEALVQYIDRPDTPISEMMIHVRRTVHERTGGRQIPWDRSELFEPFMFKASDHRTIPVRELSPAEKELAREEEYWNLIKDSGNVELLRSFVAQFPKSLRRREALDMVDILRFRRAYTHVAYAMASVIGLVAAVLFGFVVFNYSKLSNFGDANNLLDDADFVGGDIALTPGGYGETMFFCRMRCIFDTKCNAISFDPIKGVCYLKSDVYYFVRPSKVQGADKSNSEYLGGKNRIIPKEATFKLYWDRTFVGEPVATEKVTADSSFADKTRTDKRTGQPFWFVDGSDCQRRCDTLKGDCQGFSYTPFGKRCRLFQSITGLAREASSGPEVHTPTVYSGCTADQKLCPDS
jgi:hypothetical protein